ncbi:hypothetical protein C4D60_Mb10t12350 [Musa balbisiana]|uniref:Uncharacterized protein n=1 Tax=Musa balbisiana TaxID=52838 RepID=A0A4S8IWI5_MUSBA|nr:hypothetical protein C4D60_Mb10t12350 [Musa balbisiana]
MGDDLGSRFEDIIDHMWQTGSKGKHFELMLLLHSMGYGLWREGHDSARTDLTWKTFKRTIKSQPCLVSDFRHQRTT